MHLYVVMKITVWKRLSMTTTDYINILNAGSGLNTKIMNSLIVAERTLENLISDKKEELRSQFQALVLLNKIFRS